MADYYGVNATKMKSIPPDMLAPNSNNAKVRVSVDTYEANGEAAASVIHMFKIPKGARVLGGSLLTDDLSADATISVGISGTAAKYLAATVCTTANQKTDFSLIDTLGVELTAEEEIILTTGVSAITGTIRLIMYYAME